MYIYIHVYTIDTDMSSILLLCLQVLDEAETARKKCSEELLAQEQEKLSRDVGAKEHREGIVEARKGEFRERQVS